MEDDADRGVRPPETMSLRDENEWLKGEVVRLRKLVPMWHVQDELSGLGIILGEARMIGYSVAVTMRDVLDVPRDALIGSHVEKYRAGLVREVNRMEREHHERTKQVRRSNDGSPRSHVDPLFE